MFKKRWLMFDIARQRTFNADEFVMLLDLLEKLEYNGLGIYIEGAYGFESIPGIIRDGVLDIQSVNFILEEAGKRGIKVFPMTNVVGHMEHFLTQERFAHLRMEDKNQLNFFLPEAEEYVMNIVNEYVRAFRTDLMHIGGDEVTLTEETKKPYAEFLSKICDNLLADGITPAIWDDMIWMDPELTDVFSRDVFMFDWNYYGHRPESIKFFKEKGFRDIIVCPCENSWEGIINFQRISGHLKARRDIPIAPDEIEAFFVDAHEQSIDNGMLTTWNNETGRNLWAQLVPIARSALYMNGKYEPNTRDDEKIELALFGRVTPYTKLTYMLQNDIQIDGKQVPYFQLLRNALYTPSRLLELIKVSPEYAEKLSERFDRVIPELDKTILEWIPQTELEERCCSAMYAVIATIKASYAIVKAGANRKLYAKAAEVQFKSACVCRQMLRLIANGFKQAALAVESLSDIFSAAIENTGHTYNDIERLQKTVNILYNTGFAVDNAGNECGRIPLANWNKLISGNFEV